jgi:imidazolonepropionase-like amidohydrolase
MANTKSRASSMKPGPCFVSKSVWRVLSIRVVLPNAFLIFILLQGYLAYPGPPATRKLPLPFQMDPYPSTYRPLPRTDTLITNAIILDGAGHRMDGASLLLHSGKVAAIGKNLATGNAVVIDAGGRWITPGLIDVHTHDGDDSAPLTRGTADVNEDTDPNTANVWAEHSVNTQDPSFATALAAGVTTMNILPGSDNIFGGRSVVVKSIPAVTVQDMKFPQAPYSLKMACGESPKEAYGSKGRFPSTRMGEVAAEREAFLRAADYLEKWLAYERGDASSPPARDLRMDTLAGVLHGDILVQMHCYTAADMGVPPCERGLQDR